MLKLKPCLLSVFVLFSATATSPAFAQAIMANRPTAADTIISPGAASPTTAPSEPDSTAPSPYQLKLQYTGEEWDNMQGGRETGAIYMQSFDTQLRVDTDEAFGWTGGKFLVEGYYAGSRSVSGQLVGNAALDSSSPIDTYGAARVALYQAYYDQNFGANDFLLGVWDPQAEFANTAQQNLFLNRNFTWNTALDLSGQSVNWFGNYPWTTVAFRARHDFDDEWTIQGAILNGMKDDVNHLDSTNFIFGGQTGVTGIAEVNYSPAARTKIYVGYWGYTSKQPAYDETNPDGSQRDIYGSEGGYIGGGTRLYTQEGKRGLDIFGNLGVSDPVTNEIDHSLNAGLTYTGLLDARPNDAAGLAVSFGGASDQYRKSQILEGATPAHYETNIEMTYHAKINDWLKVQPDVQYIIHPNLDTSMRDAVVVGVHFEIGHWFGL